MNKITKEEFDKIVYVFEQAGYEPREYSGRGMYGKKCLGITCDRSAAVLILRFSEVLMDEVFSSTTIPETIPDGKDLNDVVYDAIANFKDEVIKVFGFLESAREDSLGKDTIVYWPNIPWLK